MPYLPRHVEGLKPWLNLASEVVVVDSYSTDGTLDYLGANLSHPALRFVSHPPGLYASWNHGIAEIKSEYVFIATTGDTITREGICKLVDVAKSLSCDVVISKPTFCDPTGRALPDIGWPIDDIITTLGVTQPRKLHKLEAVIFAITNPNAALTGSCASCLFRTITLQKFPFPTDFGTTGDGAWGRMHAAEITWGVVTDKLSSFMVHPTNASHTEKQTFRAARRGDVVLQAAMDSWKRSGVISDSDLAAIGWSDLMVWLTRYLDAKAEFDQNRHSKFPWALNPRAWRNRIRRERSAEQLRKLKQQALGTGLSSL